MRKKASVILIFILILGMSVIFAGCGAGLDRDIIIQGMNAKVPSKWAETAPSDNSETRGVFYYEEKDDEQREDETANKIIIRYETLRDAVNKTAADAIEAKRVSFETEYGITYWSIDEEEHRIIDGAEVSLYEYSFIKDIDGIVQKYEGQVIYVYSADMCYEMAVYGDGIQAAELADSIKF